MKAPTLSSIVLTVASLTAGRAEASGALNDKLPHLSMSREERQRIMRERNLKIDYFDDDADVCYHPETDTYDQCDFDRFPKCNSNELICYNRTNRRDKFYDDWHPYFYIEYHRVMCYPASWEGWGGCSSCSPGRYCKSENRCILDEQKYSCPGW